MSITIKTIDIISLPIEPQNGSWKVTGSYGLKSDKGKIIAKQSFNGYSDIKHEWSKDTLSSLDEFITNLIDDIETESGIKEAINELKK